MANRDRITTTTHLTFSGAGTQTITISNNYSANVIFLDLSAAALRTATIKVGSVYVAWKGWFTTTPVQLTFGENGRGSGVNGENVSVTVDDACEIFIGVRQTKKQDVI